MAGEEADRRGGYDCTPHEFVDGVCCVCREPDNEKRLCSECKSTKPADVFAWTHDRYGNPWRKVCDDCYEKVEAQIAGWTFDAADAGESLEEDY